MAAITPILARSTLIRTSLVYERRGCAPQDLRCAARNKGSRSICPEPGSTAASVLGHSRSTGGKLGDLGEEEGPVGDQSLKTGKGIVRSFVYEASVEVGSRFVV